MRILVCSDRIGALSSAEAGAALARAFVGAAPHAQVAVVPMGATGEDLAGALAALGDDSAVVFGEAAAAPAGPGVPVTASSASWGRLLAAALADRPRRVVLDLTGLHTHDGGAGILGALGATANVRLDAGVAALDGLTTLDLGPARTLLGETELVAVVPGDQLDDMLLGLRGVTARRTHLAGIADPATMLATDAALGRLAELAGVPDAPGLGAAGGAPLAVMALGGWLTTGPALVTQAASLERTARMADVVVTGCDELDAVTRGGPVVTEVVAVAERAQRPCAVVAGEVSVSGREMRTFGIESAHGLGLPPAATASDVTRAAEGAAISWTR